MWTGHEGLCGFSWCRVLNGAKIRGIQVGITIKQAWDLYEKQNRKCALSGADIIFAKTTDRYVHGEQTASLDRIDSSKGYIEGNVQWVHKDVNKMKMDCDQAVFIQWCKQIAAHS